METSDKNGWGILITLWTLRRCPNKYISSYKHDYKVKCMYGRMYMYSSA